jgi:uncharacterized membrane protein YgcG
VRTRITAALVAVLALVSWVSALASPARAAAPLRLSGELTDPAGVLGSQRGAVQAAITRLYDQDRVKLYVVYVPDFSGLSPTSWVDHTAARNGLGPRDILLGVATTDRNYAIGADPAMGLSTTDLDAVNATAIEPALRQSNWAAAATGAAVGFAAVIAGRPVPAPSLRTAVASRTGPARHGPAQHGTGQHGTAQAAAPSPGVAQAGLSGTDWAAIAGGAVLLLGLLLFAGLALSRRRAPGGRAPNPPAGPSTAELAALAASALVATDDAIKTSDQELGFAVARFGEQAAAPFSAALKAARAEIAAAFKLRQLLDDDIPETEPVQRSMLTEISGRCGRANQILDEQSQAFDELQDLEARAPQVLAEVDHHVTQQDARAALTEQTLTRLEAKYSPTAAATVTSSPGQARERLEFARGRLAAARQSLAADSADEAAVGLQAAESAADQAEALLDGIGHLEAELTQAASALPTALREIDADVAEATALHTGPSDGWATVVARAQAAAAAAREQLAANQPFDPLAALRQVEEAGADLDHSLGTAREHRDRQERARAVLDQAMLVARSSVTAAEDFITTRRGGVGAGARTRLAEAHRHFQQAIASARDDPDAAVAEAQHADVLGQQARSLAEQDVADFSRADHGPVISGGGAGFGGAILGGILVDSLFGGRGSGGRRGGFGSGLGLGGLGPGSFGGTGTRGRHSIGGRF